MSDNFTRCFWQAVLLLGGAALLYVAWRQPDFGCGVKEKEPAAPAAVWRGNPDKQVFHAAECRYFDSPGCTVRFRSRQYMS